jgi:uncharacterized protein
MNFPMKFHLERMNNMVKNIRYLSAFLLIFFIAAKASSQQLPEPMVPLRLVNDFTGFLSEDQQIALNNKLLDFNNQTSTQIYVVTYDELQDYPIEEFADKLAEKWGIGQKGKDNGIIILISPKNHQHGITIQTGYGLEGAVPDALAKRVIEKVIIPDFKQGNYYAGLDSATNVLMALTRGEFTADNYMKKGSGGGQVPGAVFVIIIILFILFSKIFGNRRRTIGRRGSILPWLLLGAGTHSGSGWGNFSSGGGSFGGGGGFGGGFGGGGGGSFGGGGASGGW